MPIKIHPAHDALFLDIDGTLLDIAPSAQEVVIPSELLEGLACLHENLGGALALISGRTINDIDQLFAPFRFPCAGVHGAQWRLTSKGKVENGTLLPKSFRRKCLLAFSGMKGVQFEDKGWAIAVHYRQSFVRGDVIEEILSGLIKEIFDLDLILMHGRKVAEVTHAVYNKGRALERFLSVAPFKDRRPVFLGDDVTDLSAMGASLKKGGIAARVGKGKLPRSAFSSPYKVRKWIERLTTDLC